MKTDQELKDAEYLRIVKQVNNLQSLGKAVMVASIEDRMENYSLDDKEKMLDFMWNFWITCEKINYIDEVIALSFKYEEIVLNNHNFFDAYNIILKGEKMN